MTNIYILASTAYYSPSLVLFLHTSILWVLRGSQGSLLVRYEITYILATLTCSREQLKITYLNNKLTIRSTNDRGAVYMDADDMTRAYWRVFPARMHDWLTNEQNINPFDAAAPMDAM